jgi:superfamily II DNA helicase RecQ
MRVKLFTFRYSNTLGGFDDRPLVHFMRDKEVLAFREHFFCVNEVPHLLCVLTWQDALVSNEDMASAHELRHVPAADPTRAPLVPPAETRPSKRKRGAAPDPMAGLDERERALFNTLRDWRAKKAREEGVPPYIVFTNKHLVELVTTRPGSPTSLGNLHGVGPGKVERYGKSVLAILAESPVEATK